MLLTAALCSEPGTRPGTERRANGGDALLRGTLGPTLWHVGGTGICIPSQRQWQTYADNLNGLLNMVSGSDRRTVHNAPERLKGVQRRT